MPEVSLIMRRGFLWAAEGKKRTEEYYVASIYGNAIQAWTTVNKKSASQAIPKKQTGGSYEETKNRYHWLWKY